MIKFNNLLKQKPNLKFYISKKKIKVFKPLKFKFSFKMFLKMINYSNKFFLRFKRIPPIVLFDKKRDPWDFFELDSFLNRIKDLKLILKVFNDIENICVSHLIKWKALEIVQRRKSFNRRNRSKSRNQLLILFGNFTKNMLEILSKRGFHFIYFFTMNFNLVEDGRAFMQNDENNISKLLYIYSLVLYLKKKKTFFFKKRLSFMFEGIFSKILKIRAEEKLCSMFKDKNIEYKKIISIKAFTKQLRFYFLDIYKRRKNYRFFFKVEPYKYFYTLKPVQKSFFEKQLHRKSKRKYKLQFQSIRRFQRIWKFFNNKIYMMYSKKIEKRIRIKKKMYVERTFIWNKRFIYLRKKITYFFIKKIRKYIKLRRNFKIMHSKKILKNFLSFFSKSYLTGKRRGSLVANFDTSVKGRERKTIIHRNFHKKNFFKKKSFLKFFEGKIKYDFIYNKNGYNFRYKQNKYGFKYDKKNINFMYNDKK